LGGDGQERPRVRPLVLVRRPGHRRWLKEAWNFAVSIPQGLAVSLTCFLRPNVCVEYPEYRDELPENFRGRHMLKADEQGVHKCIACRACERVCPDRLILISAVRNPESRKLELTGFLLDNSRCCFCGLCEDACPTDAIKHTPEYEYSCYERNELVIDIFGEYLERSAELREKFGGDSVS
jgi:NADH-quinone oxidoreductase subunit I